ncbi:MAG: hypothetical protein ACYDHY_17330 [Acidiferrobacterales bacterium]
MASGPKNYTTSIPVRQTVGEVMDCLAQHGADQVVLRYDGARQPVGIGFSIATANGHAGYHLPVNVEAQLELIENGLVKLDEVMLPFRLVDGQGTTVYQALVSGQIALPEQAGR